MSKTPPILGCDLNAGTSILWAKVYENPTEIYATDTYALYGSASLLISLGHVIRDDGSFAPPLPTKKGLILWTA